MCSSDLPASGKDGCYNAFSVARPLWLRLDDSGLRGTNDATSSRIVAVMGAPHVGTDHRGHRGFHDRLLRDRGSPGVLQMKDAIRRLVELGLKAKPTKS